VPVGRTDTDRLRSGELVYTGAKRTPVCALLPLETAAEWFATTNDVYVMLCHLPEDPLNTATADGRPMTRVHAHARLARMLGGDGDLIPVRRTHEFAMRAAEAQRRRIKDAVISYLGRTGQMPRTLVFSGSGDFIARATVDECFPMHRVSLADRLGSAVSEAAPAYAVAVLLSEGR
jgi:(4-(4-[2-(gamma-L-glutamylamino)ethyl]phenoxymethyl)furan-2-yl)methanamine synthase